MHKEETEKIILGIDPGTTLMGYGVIRVVGKKAQMVAMGVIDLRKMPDPYLRLGHIFERVSGIIDAYLPDELAIEAPFFGKNVQSMLKLGRHTPRHSYTRVCATENKDGHNGARTSFERTSGWYVEAYVEAKRRRHA